jgi:hypothetical protein
MPIPRQDPTTTFLREVDEALQQERLLAIWHRYKWLLLAAILGMLLVIAGMQGWQAWQRHQERTLADRWYAYTQLNSDAARHTELNKLLVDSKSGIRALTVYQQADLAKTPAEKDKAYALIYNGNFPVWLQDMARLNAAIALLSSNEAAAKSHLEILSQSKDATFLTPAYAPAMELLAMLAQKQGDATTARNYTEKLLQTPGLPADIRQRALMRLGALSTLPH